MLSLSERHADRMKRKALAVMGNGTITVGGDAEKEGPFVLGEDGFDRAGIGNVNTDIAPTLDPAEVNQVKGQTMPVQGAAVDEARDAAQAEVAEQEANQAATAEGEPKNDSHLAWGSTGKGPVAGMPAGSKAAAKADAKSASGDDAKGDGKAADAAKS